MTFRWLNNKAVMPDFTYEADQTLMNSAIAITKCVYEREILVDIYDGTKVSSSP